MERQNKTTNGHDFRGIFANDSGGKNKNRVVIFLIDLYT